MCQKTTTLQRIKFNQEILTKLLKRMHRLSINLLCSSDYQTTYSFCEIKDLVKQANSSSSFYFLVSFLGVTSEKYHMFHHQSWEFSKLYVFTDLIYHLWWGDMGWSWVLPIDLMQVIKNLAIKQSCVKWLFWPLFFQCLSTKLIISDNQCICLPEDICFKVNHCLLFLAYCNDQTWELVVYIWL